MESTIHIKAQPGNGGELEGSSSKSGTDSEGSSKEHIAIVAVTQEETLEIEEEYDEDDYEEVLDHFSEEEEETEFDLKFRKRRVEYVKPDVIYDYRTDTVASATEPIRGIEAHFRTHKHVYPQDGKTYILTHGFYE